VALEQAELLATHARSAVAVTSEHEQYRATLVLMIGSEAD
jgi:hypothetical protein